MNPQKPRQRRSQTQPGYPTLAEFQCGRRGFLKKLAVTGLAIGAGSLLHGRLLRASIAPDLFEIRLPQTGQASAYMKRDEYASFHTLTRTRDAGLAKRLSEHETQIVTLFSQVLQSSSCEELNDAELILAIQQKMHGQLLEYFQKMDEGRTPQIASHKLIIDFCEVEMMYDGDMVIPEYPEIE